MTISVIVPVFNAGITLEESLDSLRSQTFRDMEVVLVDDGSTDGSLEIEQRFVRESRLPCKLVRTRHEGVASARNHGLDVAEGDSLAFLDADDILLPECLQEAAKVAKENVDIVGWDWLLEKKGKCRKMCQAPYSSGTEAVRNLMQGTMRWNLWLFLVKRSLVLEHGLRFLDGCDMGEDMFFMINAFLKARTVVHLPRPLYTHRVDNATSVSTVLTSSRREEVTRNLQMLEDEMAGTEWEQYIPELKLFIKRPLLIGLDKHIYRDWYEWFPETNVLAGASQIIPLHTRLLQKMAAYRCWNGVYLYNLLYQKLNRLLFH